MLRKKLLLAVIAAALSVPLTLAANPALTKAPAKPKNIIIMIGDGMGPAYTSAYRYYKDNPDTEEIEQTVFDRLLVGMASTYPASISGYVTDSAAAATALATGVKTYNGAVSVDTQKQPIPTLMEKAKSLGLATGVAVTSQVNHATPAAFLVHNESRKNYDAIAQDYLKTDADLILGGGQKYFSEALLQQFTAKGYQHVTDIEQLSQITSGKVLGLFAEVQLPWAIDDKDGKKLSILTQKSLDLLSQRSEGFVLLIEGSLIDWAGHNNDIATAMAEMDEFASSIEIVEQFVRQNNDTLMIVTADHNTGGLSIGANGNYNWQPKVLRAIKASTDTLATLAIADEQWQTLLADKLGFTPNDKEWQALENARMQGQETLAVAIRHVIDVRSDTGWTTSGHTAMDVQVFAAGPAADFFKGQQDNTDIAVKLHSLLPKSKKKTDAVAKPVANVPAAAPVTEQPNNTPAPAETAIKPSVAIDAPAPNNMAPTSEATEQVSPSLDAPTLTQESTPQPVLNSGA